MLIRVDGSGIGSLWICPVHVQECRVMDFGPGVSCT